MVVSLVEGEYAEIDYANRLGVDEGVEGCCYACLHERSGCGCCYDFA